MFAKEYFGDLIGGGLLLSETKLVAETLLKNLSIEDWRDQFVVANLLQKGSSQTSLRYAQTIRKRLESLGKEFIHAVVQAEDTEYRQLVFLATVIHSPVLADFMKVTIKEYKRLYKSSLPLDAWDAFIEVKWGLVPGIESYSAATLKKMGTNVIRILVESGHLNSNRQRVFQPVYLLPETDSWISQLNRADLKGIIECTT